MDKAELAAIEREIRGNYDRCTESILARDPDAFTESFGPTSRGETAEGVAVTMADTRDYWVWRMRDRTVAVQEFVLVIDSVTAVSDGEVELRFVEDSRATVLARDGRQVDRVTHSVNLVRWALEQGSWSQVGGSELEVVRTVDGVRVTPEEDPVGVPAYREARR